MDTQVVSYCKIAKLPGSSHELAFNGNEISLTEALELLANELGRPELAKTKGFEVRINGALVKDTENATVADRDVVTLVGKVQNG